MPSIITNGPTNTNSPILSIFCLVCLLAANLERSNRFCCLLRSLYCWLLSRATSMRLDSYDGLQQLRSVIFTREESICGFLVGPLTCSVIFDFCKCSGHFDFVTLISLRIRAGRGWKIWPTLISHITFVRSFPFVLPHSSPIFIIFVIVSTPLFRPKQS